jgi:hypothetical protein
LICGINNRDAANRPSQLVVENADTDMRRYADFTADTNGNFGIIKIIDRGLETQLAMGRV